MANSLTKNLDEGRDVGLSNRMRGFYRDVTVPERFSRAFRRAPWDAADEAIEVMLTIIRSQETKKADLIAMMRDVEEDYAALYEPPEPAYFTLNMIKQETTSNSLTALFAKAIFR